MSKFEVDYVRVSEAATKVSTSGAAIQHEVSAMLLHLTDLQSSWRGSAATAFDGVITEWSAAQTAVEQALDSIRLALASTSTTYQEAEDAARTFFGR